MYIHCCGLGVLASAQLRIKKLLDPNEMFLWLHSETYSLSYSQAPHIVSSKLFNLSLFHGQTHLLKIIKNLENPRFSLWLRIATTEYIAHLNAVVLLPQMHRAQHLGIRTGHWQGQSINGVCLWCEKWAQCRAANIGKGLKSRCRYTCRLLVAFHDEISNFDPCSPLCAGKPSLVSIYHKILASIVLGLPCNYPTAYNINSFRLVASKQCSFLMAVNC